MKKTLATMLALLAIASLAHAVDLQQAITGDRKMDTILGRMNTEAQANPDGFVSRLGKVFNFPEQDIRQARDTHGLDPAGTYMAAAIASATQKPILVVAEEYRKNEGKGWGVMAKEMGIKPGSPAFHQMKRNGQGCVDHLRNEKRAKLKAEKRAKAMAQAEAKRHGRK